jgi:hypothetical protein
MRPANSFVRYLYNFACGGSSHELRLYESYCVEQGLGKQLACFKGSKIDDLLTQLSLSDGEIAAIKLLAEKRVDSAILDQDGRFLSDY